MTHRLWLGVVLLLVAGSAWLARGAANSSAAHAWTPDATPPRTVQLTAGEEYKLSTPEGIAALADQEGADQPTVRCTATSRSGSTVRLKVTVGPVDRRILYAVGQFQGPFSGPAAISCAGVGRVFVDDADDAVFDTAGLLVVVTVLALFVGGALTLSGVYEFARQPSRRPTPAPS
jgi:hypothetical protein